MQLQITETQKDQNYSIF